MSIFAACMLFVMFMFVYVFIAEVFTVLFRFTGLTAEKARFQVISLLTNSGYTTGEAELITNHPVRRKLAQVTMLFGYAFTVTIVSTIVNILLAVKLSQLESLLWQYAVPIVLLVVLIGLMRSKHTRRWFDDRIERVVHKWMFKDQGNAMLIMDNFAEQALAQVRIERLPAALAGKTLSECGLKEQYGVLVLLVRHKGNDSADLSAADGQTILLAGDLAVVFGQPERIHAAFDAPPAEQTNSKA